MPRESQKSPFFRIFPFPHIAVLVLAFVLCLSAAPAFAFDSGSDESDGALLLTTPGEIDFFSLSLDHSDGVYNFTTVQIDDGVTLTFRSATHGPITWLASGQVYIAGNLIFSGDDGHTSSAQFRSVPGSGGFSGGTGGNDLLDATAGGGPGAGGAAPSDADNAGGGAGHRLPGNGGNGGPSYGNDFLLPLIGGSGGGGGFDLGSMTDTGFGGGAGGGAFLLASSLVIQIDTSATLTANGGNSADISNPGDTSGGGGSGGSIRLIAPLIEGTGTIGAVAGSGANEGAPGRIRLEANDNRFSGALLPPATTGLPGVVTIPENLVPLRITEVGGVAVSPSPTGLYNPPDVVLNSGVPVTVTVAGRGIPLGTGVIVTLFTDSGTFELFATSPLTGTLEDSTASVDILIPNGFAGLFASADWTP